MKKPFSILFVVIVMFVFGSCGRGGGSSDGGTPPTITLPMEEIITSLMLIPNSNVATTRYFVGEEIRVEMNFKAINKKREPTGIITLFLPNGEKEMFDLSITLCAQSHPYYSAAFSYIPRIEGNYTVEVAISFNDITYVRTMEFPKPILSPIDDPVLI